MTSKSLLALTFYDSGGLGSRFMIALVNQWVSESTYKEHFTTLRIKTWMDLFKDWIMRPPNSYIEVLTPNLIVFGDRASKEVIKIK